MYGQPNAASTIGNRFMFTGREYDSETEHYYYRARYYSTKLGRFLNPDPIGYDDGMNLYNYVGNNPLVFIDPVGFAKVALYDGKDTGNNGKFTTACKSGDNIRMAFP